MDNNKGKYTYAENNAILYKTSEDEIGWNIRWLNDDEKCCEDVCKQEKFAKTQCLYLDRDFLASDMHLRTDIVHFNGKFYLLDEQIPYPKTMPKDIEKFEVFMEWENENDICEVDYDEVYNKQGINWGWGYLWTNVITKLSVNENMEKLGIVAQGLGADLPVFLENLRENGHAVYHNCEYSPFKWLAWLKGDKVRLIHQDYKLEDVKTEFDVLIDRELFFQTCKNMLIKMSEYAGRDLEKYNDYINKKYK